MQDAQLAVFQGNARFQVVAQLGQGGMGVVYEVYDRERQARVALKTLLRGSAEALRLFKQEFRALQDLRHPNLVKLGELIEDRGQWFFTMELVEGESFLGYVCPVTSSLLRTGTGSSSGSAAGPSERYPGTGSERRPATGDSEVQRELGSDSAPSRRDEAAQNTVLHPEAQAAMDLSHAAPGASSLGPPEVIPTEVSLFVSGSPGVAESTCGTEAPTQAMQAGADDSASLPPVPRRLRSVAFEETRLRASLAQLAHALCFLHAAGKVHRDIKPSDASCGIFRRCDWHVVGVRTGCGQAVRG